jgi:hypothetical protein
MAQIAQHGASVIVDGRSIGNRRRTERLLLLLANESIFLQFSGSHQEVIKEQASTIVANAHGGLVKLRNKVKSGQKLTLLNKRKCQKVQSRVVWTRSLQHGQHLVAFEFHRPTPSIWPVANVPNDWIPWIDRRPQSARSVGVIRRPGLRVRRSSPS